MKQPAVYIMTNKAKGTLYTGVTSNLKNRVWEHRRGSLACSLTNHWEWKPPGRWVTLRFAQPTKLVSYSMDSRLCGNDAVLSWRMSTATMDSRLRRPPPSFPRRRESIGHHGDPHGGAFLESTESSMPGSIFSGASN